MKIKVDLYPERDSYNSYLELIRFELDGENITFEVGGRELSFSHKDFIKLVSLNKAIS